MNKLSEILQYNEEFVKNKEYIPYRTTKTPDKKLVVLSCMDTRLTELLPRALNIKNGDAKFIKNAGASIMHPFGSTTRSILVAVYEFNADEVLVIGHRDCGMSHIDVDQTMATLINRGIKDDVIQTLTHAGIDVKGWLRGFNSIEESVIASVDAIKHHPLIPKDLIVHGLIIDPETGKLDVVVDGYNR